MPGAAPDARSVIAHFTEKYSVTTSNRIDTYEGKGVTGFERNIYPDDPTLSLTSTNLKPRGGKDNVWLSRKPYVGQNASIYVMLLDDAGEMAGSPVEINLKTDGETATAEAGRAGSTLYLRKFKSNDKFIAFNTSGMPIKLADVANPATSAAAAIFDDGVMHYVDSASAAANWNTGWGAIADYERTITATTYDDTPESAEDPTKKPFYSYLLAPSGGVAQPKCFKEGAKFVYKVNVPSVLYQDIVLVDYYVEYKHDATQVSILPDKFAPFMYVEGSSLVRRASDGMDLPVEFVIPKLKITTAITFTLQSTGDPSTFNFQGDALTMDSAA